MPADSLNQILKYIADTLLEAHGAEPNPPTVKEVIHGLHNPESMSKVTYEKLFSLSADKDLTAAHADQNTLAVIRGLLDLAPWINHPEHGAVHTTFPSEMREALAEAQHRFHFHEPSSGRLCYFYQANAAAAKAEELGICRLQSVDAKGRTKQVEKVGNHWECEDGQLLADLQNEIDAQGLMTIEARSAQRATGSPRQNATVDAQMALADVYNFLRIQNPDWQESAAVAIVNNTRQFPDYKTGLDDSIFFSSGTVNAIYDLDAQHEQKLQDKEKHKETDWQKILHSKVEEGKVPLITQGTRTGTITDVTPAYVFQNASRDKQVAYPREIFPEAPPAGLLARVAIRGGQATVTFPPAKSQSLNR